MRVAELNMTNSSHKCPSGLRQRNNPIRTCVPTRTNCSTVRNLVEHYNFLYSKVCGRIIGYQIGTTDAFRRNGNINSAYVDGVSLTHGSPRRTHIWTFAAGFSQESSHCPCSPRVRVAAPGFVGNDYFCDSGNRNNPRPHRVFYDNNPLWDGVGCATCCSNSPLFYKQLPRPTTDAIEMRVCRDQNSNDEDIAIESVEIYIQ